MNEIKFRFESSLEDGRQREYTYHKNFPFRCSNIVSNYSDTLSKHIYTMVNDDIAKGIDKREKLWFDGTENFSWHLFGTYYLPLNVNPTIIRKNGRNKIF